MTRRNGETDNGGFSRYFLPTPMTNWAKLFTGLLFDIEVMIHEVWALDNTVYRKGPMAFMFTDVHHWNHVSCLVVLRYTTPLTTYHRFFSTLPDYTQKEIFTMMDTFLISFYRFFHQVSNPNYLKFIEPFICPFFLFISLWSLLFIIIIIYFICLIW